MLSLDESEAPTLRFRTAQDTIDYAHRLTEDSNRRFAALSLDAVERYVKGDACLVVRARIQGETGECDFVFVRVPIRVSAAHASNETLDPHVVGEINHSIIAKSGGRLRNLLGEEICPPDVKRHKSAVFLGVTELIQGPEGVIPSFVWVEAPKQRQDFRWQILAAATANYRVESGKIVPEGELSTFRIDFSSRDGARVTRLVENCAEIISGVENYAGEIGWKPPRELDLVKVLTSYEILLNNFGPWLVIHKLIDFGIEIVDVMLCAQDREARAGKGVAYGCQSVRSDKRA